MRAAMAGFVCLLGGLASAASLLPDIGTLAGPVGDDFPRHLRADGRTVYSISTEPAAAMSGVRLSVEDDAIVVDTSAAPPALGKTTTRIVTIKQTEFPEACYALRATVQGPKGAVATLYFEGTTLAGKHYYNSTNQRLTGKRQEITHYYSLAPRLKYLHMRLDYIGRGEFRIYAADFAPIAILRKDPAVAAARVPQLLFQAGFDGTATATAQGNPEPLASRGLAFGPGVKGQALKSTLAAGTLLQYAMPGNAVQECGTISLWFRPSWTRPEDAKGFHHLFAMERPKGSRLGSGSTFLWCHNDVIRADTSDLRDSYQRVRSVEPSRWQHIAMTWDEDGARVYYNGRSATAMPGGDSYSPLTPQADKQIIFRDSQLKTFFIGNLGGGQQCEGSIDDMRIYSAPLSSEQVLAVAREMRYFDVAASDRYFTAKGGGNDRTMQFTITPRQPSPMRFTWKVLAEDGRIVAASEKAIAVPSAVDKPIVQTLELKALAPGRYEIRVTESTCKASALQVESAAFWIFEARNPETSPTAQLRTVPLATIRPNLAMTAEQLLHLGPVRQGKLAGRDYLEAGDAAGNRFVVRLSLPDAKGVYLLEWDYPDDKVRTVDILAQSARIQNSEYELQTGYITGDEYANSGQMLTQKCVYYARSTDAALIFTTAREGAPAAVAEIRVSRIVDGLPPQGEVTASTGSVPRRDIGVYYEDPALLYDFGCYASAMPGLETMLDRLGAYMKYSGQNLLTYPLVWYQGRIGDKYNPRNHPDDFLQAVLTQFDRDGLGFMASFNQHNIYFPDLVINQERIDRGELHDTPISIWNTGKPNPGGWHGTSPNFNILHPGVQANILANVDHFLAIGAPHPSFKGINLHLTKHCLAWFGNLEAGYNDYAIDAFTRDTGVAVPVPRDEPMRGKAYYEWLMANAREQWIDWRCRAVAQFYLRIAERLRAARPDLRLNLCNFTPMADTKSDIFRAEDFAEQVYRGAGLDPKHLVRDPSITVVQTTYPADYRWRQGRRTEARNFAHLRTFDLLPGTYSLLREAPAPWLHMHDRYWESAMGRERGKGWDGPGKGKIGQWFHEQGWRVSTLNPAGYHAMRHYVAPLRFNDLLGITKGGFLVGTHGMEPHLVPFAKAFRALPARRFQDVQAGTDTLKVRQLALDGKTWFYVVNTAARPTTASLTLSLPAADLLDGKVVPAGAWRLPLAPYEFRSFRAAGSLKIGAGER
jgi:hypothetical protein